MIHNAEPTKTASGFSLDLGNGVQLIGTHVPGHEESYLGVKTGNTFIAVARFLSDDHLKFLYEVLASRFIVATPVSHVDGVG